MIDILVGGQMGSEGKGLIAGLIGKNYEASMRVGAANAGHTLYVDGDKFVLQQIPCAAYANPEALLLIGPGGMISEDILIQELKDNIAWRKTKGHPDLRLYIDHRAHIVTDEHIEAEQQTSLAEDIGSTSTVAREGIGAAQAARVMRNKRICKTAAELETPLYQDLGAQIRDTNAEIQIYRGIDHDLLLEGTQGTGLSVTHGFWPFTTSRDTTASGIAADCGVGPRDVRDVILVLRTFPIRVSGNSGPFYNDGDEITFEDIGVLPEYTTVTQLKRRVAQFSTAQAREAVAINGATMLALTFADYIDPDLFNESDAEKVLASPSLLPFIVGLQDMTNLPVSFVGTGPRTCVVMS